MELMCHVVAGYPSKESCIELMLGMQQAGVGVIEVQIPFSDPIADGETIMQANDRALENGMDTASSFELIKTARKRGLKTNLYLMSYVQKVIHYGIENFVHEAVAADAAGLIIPDLPFDSPEYERILEALAANQLEIVPVISPGMSKRRLADDLAGRPRLIYLTSTKGITGNKLSVSDGLGKLSEAARELSPGSTLAIGFGIQTKQDVSDVLEIADIAVVGSAVIREVEKSGVQKGLDLIKNLAA